MRYYLGVEDIEPDHWVAWVFELPGCFASAHTQTKAVAAAPARIAAYFRWLATYGHSMPGAHDPIETDVVTVFHAFPSESNYLVNAFFEADRSPLTQQEIEQALWLLDCSRQDLLAVLHSASSDRLTQPIAGEVHGSIRGILQHIAHGERLFFTFEIWTIFYAWSDDRAGHFEVTSSVVRPGVESAHHSMPGW
jgi:predicted RNase H-like HicB family nuclease